MVSLIEIYLQENLHITASSGSLLVVMEFSLK